MSRHLYADIACALPSLLPNDPARTFQNHIHMAPRNRGDITGVLYTDELKLHSNFKIACIDGHLYDKTICYRCIWQKRGRVKFSL